LRVVVGGGLNSFTASTDSIPSIAADGTATFTIEPKIGLSPAAYSDIVTVYGENGIGADFSVVLAVDSPKN
jgi:hypothetical protein